jgi:hypothetical protein
MALLKIKEISANIKISIRINIITKVIHIKTIKDINEDQCLIRALTRELIQVQVQARVIYYHKI